jgi:hypothetical protein
MGGPDIYSAKNIHSSSSQRDGGARRSMIGMNNYEKMFFGANN